jgi:DNA-binding MarR family transcriptional regulator
MSMGTSEHMITVLDQVLEVAVLINRDMNSSLGDLGLTPARTHLLWELLHRGPSTQRVLAEALDVTPRNVTGLVDALAETGYVTRRPHPVDRRATLVTLTDHGTDVTTRMQKGQEHFARLLFADMSDRQLDALRDSLEHVLSRLREVVPKGEPQ